jgi:hypothetical protein
MLRDLSVYIQGVSKESTAAMAADKCR